MAEVIQLGIGFATVVRLKAAAIYPLNRRERERAIRDEAGRAGEHLRMQGAERWQAIHLEDELRSALWERLAELDASVGGVPCSVHRARKMGGVA